MTRVKINGHPWIKFIVGLIVLAVTTFYYQNILDDYVIYYGTVDIFRIYGCTVILIGLTLTAWAYFKAKTISRMWLLLCVLALNFWAIIYFAHKLDLIPGHFTLKLTNKTTFDLTDLRFTNCKESKFDVLKKGETIDCVFNHHSEYYDIDLIFNLEDSSPDTINLTKHVTNSCGYYEEIILTLENGKVIKH